MIYFSYAFIHRFPSLAELHPCCSASHIFSIYDLW